MPIGGSSPAKTFTRAYSIYSGADCVQQADAAGRTIQSVDQDGEGNDQAAAINAMLMLDGGNWAADIPTNGNGFTGVRDAAARTEFAAAGQIADGEFVFATTSGNDTITASLSPAVTALVTGMHVVLKAGGTNTGAATLNLNSIGATNIRKGPDAATTLAAGDITAGGIYLFAYTGAVWHLLNPKFPAGFATGDSPQFTGIELGHASDTTLTRSGAGDIAVEGNAVYRAGGTDVAIADGGTGASTAAAAFTALKQAATTAATGVVQLADAAAMEALTSGRVVTADLQHRHPAHPKAGGVFNGTGTPAYFADYGMGAITDNGAGDYTLAFDTAFNSTSYWWAGTSIRSGGACIILMESVATARTSSAVTVNASTTSTNNLSDVAINNFTISGDYA